MGIFVSIFSLITVNFNQLNSKNLTGDFILKMNLFEYPQTTGML